MRPAGISFKGARIAIGFSAFVVALLPALAGHAHHSFAMYDQTQDKTVTGKLIRFIPGANHAQLIFELVDADGKTVLDEDGKPAVWGAEMGSAAQIADAGVTVKSFPLGTILTVTVYPLRDGRPFGAQARDTVLVSCGMAMPAGGCTEATGQVYFGE